MNKLVQYLSRRGVRRCYGGWEAQIVDNAAAVAVQVQDVLVGEMGLGPT